MDASIYISLMSLGAMAGAAGQVVRMVVGLKKLLGEPAEDNPNPIKSQRIVISLLIGATAGLLAALVSVDTPDNISIEQVLALVAAGYAGADFIEGVMKNFKPSSA